jgi:hypothetical protein
VLDLSHAAGLKQEGVDGITSLVSFARYTSGMAASDNFEAQAGIGLGFLGVDLGKGFL